MASTSNIVVTGAGGFVGGFLAGWFADRGHRVTAITRGALPEGAAENLHWRQANIATSGSLPERFDVLLHCAAELPSRCSDSVLLYDRNMDAAKSVFKQAVAARAGIIVALSSMSAYGAISVPLVTENTPPDNPDPYGRAKLDAEVLLNKQARENGFSGLSIRLPGTVGRGSRNNFLSDVMARILRGETVTVRNPQALFNNIVYVGDLAAFLAKWIAAPRPGHAVINLAARDPMPIGDVIRLMFRSAGMPERASFETGGKAPFLISTERAVSLGYDAPTVEASLRALVADCIAPREARQLSVRSGWRYNGRASFGGGQGD